MAGSKLPVLHGFDRFFVEAHSQAAQHVNVAGPAVGSDDEADGADSLVLRFASFLGKFGFGRIDRAGSAGATADVEDSATNAATFTGTKARPFARSNATAAAGANTAARTSAV